MKNNTGMSPPAPAKSTAGAPGAEESSELPEPTPPARRCWTRPSTRASCWRVGQGTRAAADAQTATWNDFCRAQRNWRSSPSILRPLPPILTTPHVLQRGQAGCPGWVQEGPCISHTTRKTSLPGTFIPPSSFSVASAVIRKRDGVLDSTLVLYKAVTFLPKGANAAQRPPSRCRCHCANASSGLTAGKRCPRELL